GRPPAFAGEEDRGRPEVGETAELVARRVEVDHPEFVHTVSVVCHGGWRRHRGAACPPRPLAIRPTPPRRARFGTRSASGQQENWQIDLTLSYDTVIIAVP